MPLIALLLAAGAALPFAESHFDTVSGVSLHYRYWNVAPTELKGSILFVHGFCGSTFSWRYNIDTMTRSGYRVVAVDLPAYGYSDRKLGLDQSQPARAELLWKLLDEIDMKYGPPCRPIRWTLVGHSMGGGAVAAMALQRPERAAALVLVDPAIYSNPSNPWTRALLRIRPVRALFEAYARGSLLSRRSVARFVASAYGRKPDSAAVSGYLAPLQLPGTVQAIVDGVIHSRDRGILPVQDIALPTLIFWGDNDTWVRPADGERLYQEIPNSELEFIHDGGHTPMETEPQEFNELLAGFLTRSGQ